MKNLLAKVSLSLAALCMTATAFADEAATGQAPAKGGNFVQTLLMIGIAIVFFYFILWRPEQKRRKTMEAQRSAMKKGDRVTAMGIIGKIVKVQDTTVILSMVDGAKIEVLKAAITDVQPGTDEDARKAEKAETTSVDS
jgi:preprotein translocase subunit YajC